MKAQINFGTAKIFLGFFTLLVQNSLEIFAQFLRDSYNIETILIDSLSIGFKIITILVHLILVAMFGLVVMHSIVSQSDSLS